VVGREERITSPADIRVHQEELTGGGGRREKVIPGMATGEIRRGEGRRRGAEERGGREGIRLERWL